MSKIIYRGYTPWINMYALDAYQVVAADERATIHRQWSNAGGPVGLQALTETLSPSDAAQVRALVNWIACCRRRLTRSVQ